LEIYDDFNILIVDDEGGAREVVKDYLSDFVAASIVIFEAGDGEMALSILKKEKIDLTILDIKMPGINGLDLLAKIRQEYPETVNIMLSGYGEKKNILRALELRAYDFLEKPIEKEILLDRVLKALSLCYLKKFLSYELREVIEKHCNPHTLEDFDVVWDYCKKFF